LVFLNPDVELPDSKILSSAVERFTAGGQSGVYSPLLLQGDGSHDRACARNIPQLASALRYIVLGRETDYHIDPAVSPPGLLPVGAVNGAFMLVDAGEFARLGRFYERYWMYAEDLDLCLRYTKAGRPVVLDTSISAVHLKAGTTGGSRSLGLRVQFMKAMAQFYWKHELAGRWSQ
jgi:GT2 family glycosyltransferase